MGASEAFKDLLSVHLAPALKQSGFRKKGQSFGRRGDGVWGVINFQRSQWSSRECITFTINVGVWVDAVAAFRLEDTDRVPRTGAPPEAYCHWRQRIGWLLPDQRDIWWDVEEPRASWQSALKPRLIENVRTAVVQYAAPHLLRLDSGAALLRWLRRHPQPGMFPMHRAALERLYGTSAEFNRTAKRIARAFRGTEWEQEKLAKLRTLGFEA
jgi:hypothetical protein